MPIELNKGLKDLLMILLLSFGVMAYDGNPYLIDDHRTPINPFHTIFLAISEDLSLLIIEVCFSIMASIWVVLSPVKSCHTPIIFSAFSTGRLKIL